MINAPKIMRENHGLRRRITDARGIEAFSEILATLEASLYLVGSVYNFCMVRRSLGRTPAMTAGLSGELWTMERLLWHRVPLPRWKPVPH